MIEFAEEPLVKMLSDGAEMFFSHYHEVMPFADEIELNPDIDFYYRAEEQGILKALTARSEGKLVGYAALNVYPDPRTSKLTSSIEHLYLTPSARAGKTALRFLEFIKAKAKELGAMTLSACSKLKKDYSRLLEHLGFSHVDSIYCHLIA